MKATVLVIHGAGPRSYRIMSEKWIPYMNEKLGSDFHLLCPEMPDPQFPQFAKWKEIIRKNLMKIKGPVVLVGHSLGGAILWKYLSEEQISNPVLGFYMIAAPYFGIDGGWNYRDFVVHENPTELLSQFPVFSYHSVDDEVVPVGHQEYIAKKIPHAMIRTLDGHGHEFNKKEFKEIIHDLKNLKLPYQRQSHSA